ncbi:hypothetical protein [Amycolatopsis kentuckyensis]|uniref:hypothetical protein n=1 Tax=Amycolatopsis kentuckyensis TaxID=218823 RepID=UPI001302245D|nr:hypothetical protein [Amycolatopsis kentuckyensis]
MSFPSWTTRVDRVPSSPRTGTRDGVSANAGAAGVITVAISKVLRNQGPFAGVFAAVST